MSCYWTLPYFVLFCKSGSDHPVLLSISSPGELHPGVAVRVYDHRQVLPVVFHETGAFLRFWECSWGGWPSPSYSFPSRGAIYFHPFRVIFSCVVFCFEKVWPWVKKGEGGGGCFISSPFLFKSTSAWKCSPPRLYEELLNRFFFGGRWLRLICVQPVSNLIWFFLTTFNTKLEI